MTRRPHSSTKADFKALSQASITPAMLRPSTTPTVSGSPTVTVPVSFSEAALGGQVVVPTPGGGTVTLKIPAGTTNGRTFRVRGKGVPRKDGTKGDLLASIEVHVPSTLSDEAREALQKYAEATADEDPRKNLLSAAKVS